MMIIKKSLCIVLVLISIFAFNACGKSKESTPATYINLNDIGVDYDKNELKAKDTHEGQRYRTTVKVESVKEDSVKCSHDIDDSRFADYPYSLTSYVVTLYYEKNQADFVKNLEKGDSVTFEGTLVNVHIAGYMYFEDVVFVS